MRLPDFLIIGAAKSGTTALYLQLMQHPSLFMSAVKEPGFFALEGHDLAFAGPGDMESIGSFAVNNLDDYGALFSVAADALAVGEASTLYLYSDRASAAIKQRLPNVKMIALLRSPVERAFSAYLMMAREGRENLSFGEALEQSARRIEDGWEYIWDYLGGGLYARQLNRYFESFSPNQLLTVLHEDYCREPNQVLDQICRFIGVESWAFVPIRSNVSCDPKKWPEVRNGYVHRLMSTDSALKQTLKTMLPTGTVRSIGAGIRRVNMRIPQLQEQIRKRLIAYYLQDIAELERLIGRDLRHWMR